MIAAHMASLPRNLDRASQILDASGRDPELRRRPGRRRGRGGDAGTARTAVALYTGCDTRTGRRCAPAYFFRLKSTETTFEPSSTGLAGGSSFSASSCCGSGARHAAIGGLEAQFEVHRRIVEAGDRREQDVEHRRHLS